jgi:hypothetical protein
MIEVAALKIIVPPEYLAGVPPIQKFYGVKYCTESPP